MRTIALIKRILLQISRDKRTLALLFVAPLLVLTLMSLVFNGNAVDPVLGVANGNKQIIEKLEEADIVVKEYNKVSNVNKTILDKNLDGFLQVEDAKATITLLNNDPTKANI